MPPVQSQSMSQLSDNLTARRESLGLSVPDVHAALNRKGFSVAFSTVAGWFNGSRGVRKMEHLLALCSVLQTDLNALGGSEIELSEGAVNASIARESKDLPDAKKELVLALIRSLKEGG